MTFCTSTASASLVEAMAPLAKQMLGRPSGAHGVTPLLIFRDITGLKSA